MSRMRSTSSLKLRNPVAERPRANFPGRPEACSTNPQRYANSAANARPIRARTEVAGAKPSPRRDR
jgi:hypothetical protein